MPGRGAVRVSGALRRRSGPDLVAVRVVVRGQADDVRPWLRDSLTSFAETFEFEMQRSHHAARPA